MSVDSKSKKTLHDSESSSDDTASNASFKQSPGTLATTRSGREFRGSPAPVAGRSASSPSPSSRKASDNENNVNVLGERKSESPINEAKKEPVVAPNTSGIFDSSFVKVAVCVASILVAIYLSNYCYAQFGNTAEFGSNFKTTAPANSRDWKARLEYFDHHFQKWATSYHHQFLETRLRFDSGIRSGFEQAEPVQPSTFVLLTPPKMNPNFPACFAKSVGSIVNKAFESSSIVPVAELNLNSFQSAASITAIQNGLKSYFNQSGKAVMVHDVEKLTRHDHLFVFHAFCDNSMAYEKRATFFFILPVPEEIHKEFEWRPVNGYDIADRVLHESWKNVLSEDMRPALISRIAANVVLLNEGDRC